MAAHILRNEAYTENLIKTLEVALLYVRTPTLNESCRGCRTSVVTNVRCASGKKDLLGEPKREFFDCPNFYP